MTQPNYLTPEGEAKLQAELNELKGPKREELALRLRSAIQMGDLSENADYHKAKEDQGFLEGRIQEINGKFARAQVIDPTQIQSDKIVFGATVVLEEESGAKITYQLVGVDEADIKKNKIGITSPLARSLIGKKEGDEVEVNAPKGKINYTVIEISYL